MRSESSTNVVLILETEMVCENGFPYLYDFRNYTGIVIVTYIEELKLRLVTTPYLLVTSAKSLPLRIMFRNIMLRTCKVPDE